LVLLYTDYTTQQYFERNRFFLFPNAHTIITTTCLTYLTFDKFKRDDYCRTEELLVILLCHVFIDYAAHDWTLHAQEQADEICRVMILDFLQDKVKFTVATQVILYPGRRLPHDLSGMHMSSLFGLKEIVIHQLEKGAEVDLRDSEGRTPLSWAAQMGHETVVKLLVARDDVDINSKDIWGRTPLSVAAERGHEAVVATLLACAAVNMNSKESGDLVTEYISGERDSAPSFAASTEQEEIANLLLIMQNNVEVDSKDSVGGTPLALAAESGHEAVVKLLLAHDNVDVNSKDRNGHNLLSLAARGGQEAVVELLLMRDDIEVNSRNTIGRTPLALAAEYGHETVVKLLLAQVDVDANSNHGSDGRSPLLLAVREGHDAVVKLLLTRDDVDVNSEDNFGFTSLSLASALKYGVLVQLLRARGAS
jgi:ankyrin repeat protein